MDDLLSRSEQGDRVAENKSENNLDKLVDDNSFNGSMNYSSSSKARNSKNKKSPEVSKISPKNTFLTSKAKSKHATMKDVAELAGVSTATVSYVLNYSDKKKITHETRLKVFEAADKLNYVPDKAARTLAFKRHKGQERGEAAILLIRDSKDTSFSTADLNYLNFIKYLTSYLGKNHYSLCEMTPEEIDVENNLNNIFDLAIMYNLDVNLARELTEKFYIPLALVGTPLKNILFHEINYDFLSIFENFAKRVEFVVIENLSNIDNIDSGKGIYDYFTRENVFINKSDSSLESFILEHKNKRGLIFGEVLALQVLQYCPAENLTVIISDKQNARFLSGTEQIILSSKRLAEETAFVVDKLLEMRGANAPWIINLPAEN